MFAVGCEGEGRKRRGGITLFWRDDWDVLVQSFSNNHIDFMLVDVKNEAWRFIELYGYPEEENKGGNNFK